MIEFPCQCGYGFRFEDSMAGALVQCPKCRRLVDVPTLSDIGTIADDGTFRLRDEPEPPPQARPGRVEELREAFARTHVDDRGEEIDLRVSEEDIRLAGTGPMPDDPGENFRRVTPVYDPETGELIRPIEVAKPNDDPRPAIPLAKPALTYAADPGALANATRPPALELLMPQNVFVMFCVFVIFLMGLFLAMVLSPAVILGVPYYALPLPLVMILAGHLGNVIDEIAMEGHDELPRVFRNVSWSEDVWGPFWKSAVAFATSFGPGLALYVNADLEAPEQAVAVLALLGLGTVVFPSMLLSMMLGQTLDNLRPDRIVRLIAVCGVRYIPVMILWAVSLALTIWGLYGPYVLRSHWRPAWVWNLNHWLIVFPAIALAIYLLHLAAWQTALLHRRFHARFPWVGQHHVRVGPRFPKQRRRPMV